MTPVLDVTATSMHFTYLYVSDLEYMEWVALYLCHILLTMPIIRSHVLVCMTAYVLGGASQICDKFSDLVDIDYTHICISYNTSLKDVADL